MQIAEIEHKLAAERRARLTAERLLAQKQEELFAANEKLSKHAFTLSDKIVEQRHHAEELKDENFQVRSDLRRAEQRLWTSFETIEDGFAVFDSSRRLVLANPAYMSIFDGIEAVAPGAAMTKNLFLKDKKGNYFLLTAQEEKDLSRAISAGDIAARDHRQGRAQRRRRAQDHRLETVKRDGLDLDEAVARADLRVGKVLARL